MVRKTLPLFMALFLLSPWLSAQDKAVAGAKVNVRVQLQVNVFGVERLKQISDLSKHLIQNGFETPASEIFEKLQDSKVTFLEGKTISGREKSLLHPRWVYSVISWSEDLENGLKNDSPTRMQVVFPPFMQGKYQAKFWGALKEQASKRGFQDGVGYDSEGFTRLTGNLAPSKILELDQKIIPEALILSGAQSSSNAYPRVVQIRTDWDLSKTPITQEEKTLPGGKISQAGRELFKSESTDFKRWLVVLNQNPPAPWMLSELSANLNEAVIESAMGALVQIKGSTETIKNLVMLPFVMHAAPVEYGWKPASKQPAGDGWVPFFFHEGNTQKGYQWKGKSAPASIAILGSNFQDWEKVFGEESSRVRYLDLTKIRNQNLDPDTANKNDSAASQSKAAFKATRDYPGSEVFLIRVDPATPAMQEEVAGFSMGNVRASATLLTRYDEIEMARRFLDSENNLLQQERAYLIDQFQETDELEKRRKEYLQRKQKWEGDNRQLHHRIGEILKMVEKLNLLRSVRVFLVLDEPGIQVPNLSQSVLSLFSQDPIFRKNSWAIAQSAVPQAFWMGSFVDLNNNGAMEFSSRANSFWEKELLPLRIDPSKPGLDSGTPLMVKLRWKEVCDPLSKVNADGSVVTRSRMNLVLLKRGKSLAGRKIDDEFVPVAQSGERPFCIFRSSNQAIFEHQIKLDIKEAGEYFLRVEGAIADRKTLSVLDAHHVGEIHPEIIVETPVSTSQGNK